VLINTINNKLFAVAILYFCVKQCVNYHYYTRFSTPFRVKQCVNYHYYTRFSTPLLYYVLFYT